MKKVFISTTIIIFIVALLVLMLYVFVPYKSFNVSVDGIEKITITNSNKNGESIKLDKAQTKEVVGLINDIKYCNKLNVIPADGWSYSILIKYENGKTIKISDDGNYYINDGISEKTKNFWCYKNETKNLTEFLQNLYKQ